MSTCPVTPWLGAGSMAAFDVALRYGFRSAGISFPSSLAGCGILLSTMLLGDAISPDPGYEMVDGKPVPIGERGLLGNKLYSWLAPGSDLLAKWLPIFFVPSLIALPFAKPLESAVEAAKLGVVIVGGFMFTLLTTAWSVAAARKVFGGGEDKSDNGAAAVVAAPAAAAPPPAFSAGLFQALSAGLFASGVLSMLSYGTGVASYAHRPLQYVYMLCATLSSFVFGSRLPADFRKAVHPLVTCTTISWMANWALAAATGQKFLGALGSYKTGAGVVTGGPGDLLLFLLGPAVVSLAVQMYGRRSLVKQNAAEVATAVVGSSVGGLFGTALLVRTLGMAGSVGLKLATLSRNITSPLAMAIAGMLGADASMAVSMVVVSGLFGANFGASILDKCGIRDPVARGLGIGAAAHGLGTAAFKDDSNGDAFPFAAIAMALTASFSTILVSVPAVQAALIKLALGV